MKILINRILEFEQFYTTIINQSLPLKTSYKLNKISELTSKEVSFYREQFKLIIQQYAQKDENGEIKYNDDKSKILLQEELISECQQKINELDNLEINLDVENYLLELSELDNISCTPAELYGIMNFIK